MNIKEQLERLEKSCKEAGIVLPSRINFLLYRVEGKNTIVFKKMKTTCKLENVKFENTQALILSGVATSIGVKDIESYEQLDTELNQMQRRWLDD